MTPQSTRNPCTADRAFARCTCISLVRTDQRHDALRKGGTIFKVVGRWARPFGVCAICATAVEIRWILVTEASAGPPVLG